MESESELERRNPWQPVAVGVVALLAVAVAGTMVWFRFEARPAAVPGGRLLGSVTITSPVDFSCRLPVTSNGGTAAMIKFPEGTVTVDATAPSPPAGGKGLGLYSYDSQLARWVPVQRSWLSPDGRQYAYSTTTSGVPGQAPAVDVHAHDIATGRDVTVWRGSGSAMVLGWSGSTVLFSVQGFGPGPVTPEVWGADAAGGSAHRVGPNPPTSPGYFYGGGFIGGGALWGLASSQAQPPPAPVPGKPFAKGPDTLTRMDLREGTVTRWYTAPGYGLGLVGIDGAGHPIVSLNQFIAFATPPPAGYRPPPPRLMLVTGQDRATEIATPAGEPFFGGGAPSTDSHGVWFTAPGELWLYRDGALKEVATVPAGLFPTPVPQPGGPAKPGVASAGSTAMPPPGTFLQVAGDCL